MVAARIAFKRRFDKNYELDSRKIFAYIAPHTGAKLFFGAAELS